VRVYVEGIGLCGPGLNGWEASRPVLAGAASYLPAPTIVLPSPLLASNERRRAVETVRLALAVGQEAFDMAGRDAADTATVFASSGGDGATIHQILEVLAAPDGEVSPTRFHNSVHNAPAGYWSIATRSRAPSSSLCCHDSSFAAGLLEAASQATVDDRAVALVAYDVRYPEPLNRVRPIGAAFGMAMVLTPGSTGASLARLDIGLRRGASGASVMAAAALEELRRGTPAARSLPLLAGLARCVKRAVVLGYLPGLEIGLSLEPVALAPAESSARDVMARAK
jgi:hypothetical protein